MTQDARITAAEATALIEQKLRKNEEDLLRRCYADIRRASEVAVSELYIKYSEKNGQDCGPVVIQKLRKDGFTVADATLPEDIMSGTKTIKITWPKVEYPFPEKG